MNEQLRRSCAHVFVDQIEIPVLDESDRHHLKTVLRLRTGETVTACDGRGSWRVCAWNGDGLDVSGDVHLDRRPPQALTVVISPVKGDRTDMVVEKLVEIGVDRIEVLAPVARSVVRWDDRKTAHNIDRYRRLARAAAMQSRRTYLADIVGPVSFDTVVAGGAAVAEPGGSAAPEDVSTLVVGPEGGFTPDEVARAAVTVDLGGTVLRAETAAIVGAARMVAHRTRSMRHTG